MNKSRRLIVDDHTAPGSDHPLRSWSQPGGATYSCLLGRSFLQSAFLGANWDTDSMWVAQAPGPNVQSNARLGLQPKTTMLPQKNKITLADLWKGYLTPIDDYSIDFGVIARVSMGVVTAVAVFACGAIYFSRRKKKQRQPFGATAPNLMASKGKIARTGSISPCEMSEPDTRELHGSLVRRELEAHSRPGELPGLHMHAREMHGYGRSI